MRESGWAFVGGGNIASPTVIPGYYVPDEDKSVSQRTKNNNAEDESRSPANCRLPAFFLLSRPLCFREHPPSRQIGELRQTQRQTRLPCGSLPPVVLVPGSYSFRGAFSLFDTHCSPI